jgi:hypothetical protein
MLFSLRYGRILNYYLDELSLQRVNVHSLLLFCILVAISLFSHQSLIPIDNFFFFFFFFFVFFHNIYDIKGNQQSPLKHRSISTRLHGAASKRTVSNLHTDRSQNATSHKYNVIILTDTEVEGY